MNNENSASVVLSYIDPYRKIVSCVFDSVLVRALSQIKQVIYKSQYHD